MMASKPKRKPAAKSRRTVRISAEKFTEIAAQLVPSHATLLGQGFQLVPKSNIRSRKDGSYGGTFVYSKPSSGPVSVEIVHNVSLQGEP